MLIMKIFIIKSISVTFKFVWILISIIQIIYDLSSKNNYQIYSLNKKVIKCFNSKDDTFCNCKKMNFNLRLTRSSE